MGDAYARIDAIDTRNDGTPTVVASVPATAATTQIQKVTYFDEYGRPQMGRGVSNAVTDEAVYVSTLDSIFKFDLVSSSFQTFPNCSASADATAGTQRGFTAITARPSDGAVFIARYDGESVQRVSQSSVLLLDPLSGECPLMDWPATTVQLARSMTLSADEIYLLIADQATVEVTLANPALADGDEFQTVKMVVIEMGAVVPLMGYSAAGGSEVINLRNVVDLVVQVRPILNPQP